ncbi:hypothetical protein R1sor_012768 [Riccia sorocarpa]|uniref:BHLH domain-containing protein n=1 Tax=Riccia sorocarpa TaxID=122646 RepID=A0ABD3I7F5_9MARC
MQPASLLGSRGPVPGVSSARPSSLSNAGLAMPSLLSSSSPAHPPPHHHHHHHHHHQLSAMQQFEQQAEHGAPAMDEFLEQMLSMPSSWSDRPPWENFNAAAAAAAAAAAGRLGVDAQKLFTMSLLPPGLLGAGTGSQNTNTNNNNNNHPRDLQDGADSAHVADSVLNYSNDDSHLLGARLRGLQEHSSSAPGMGSRPGGTLTRSPSVGSSGSEGSAGGGPQSPPPIAPTWRQPYVGGVPPLPLGLGPTKPESLLRGDSGEAHLLGKRPRDEDEVSMRDNVRDAPQGLFTSLVGGGQVAQNQMPRSASQQSLQQGNGASSPGMQQAMPNYGSPTGLTTVPGGNQALANSTGAAAARPRVRARRGQATDPHSIAERLRRERIAERMKALQELVPNSNKTDKASMLDEIIEYVKFLQLQVKVLSMSRLGGAGAVAPLVADLPSEVGPSNYVNATLGRSNGAPGPAQDGLALTERQVARLMEEDMGSAMQYLQSKGLCLMPISLATAISSTSSRSQAGGNGTQQQQGSGERQRSESSAAAAAVTNAPLNSTAAPSVSAALDGENGVANKSNSSSNNNAKDGCADNTKSSGGAAAAASKQSPKATTPQKFKGKEDSQRRSQ